MNDILEILIRTTVVYIVIIIGIRILGKQHVGQITINDFVLILLISNAVQNAMVGNNSSLLGGIIAAITLLILSYVLSTLTFKSANLRKILTGEKTILIYDGNFLEENLKKLQITHDELEEIMREHGCEKVTEVHSAILEIDGMISIIPIAENKTPQIFSHHRKNKAKVYLNRQDK